MHGSWKMSSQPGREIYYSSSATLMLGKSCLSIAVFPEHPYVDPDLPALNPRTTINPLNTWLPCTCKLREIYAQCQCPELQHHPDSFVHSGVVDLGRVCWVSYACAQKPMHDMLCVIKVSSTRFSMGSWILT